MKRTSPTKCPSESLFKLRRCKFPCVQLQSVWKGFHMHTAIRPYATAGVALVGASVIAVSPVAAPLPDVHIPSLRLPVELTQSTSPILSLDNTIQTALINAIMALETATNKGIATLTSAISTPFSNLGTALSNLGMTIAAGGGAFVPIGAIFGDLGTFTSLTGELILLSGEIAPAFTRPLFDIGVQLVLLASALVPGAAMAAPLQLAEPAADPGSGLSSLDSGIQTALINAIMALETATNKGIATLTSAISTPFSNLGTALSNLGMTIAAGGGAFVPIGAIFGDLGTFTSLTGELILLSGEIAPAFTRPLFDIGVQLVLLASALVPGAAMAAPLQLAEPAADPGSGLSSLDSGIQTALINAIMALETATNKGIATLTSAISTPFSNLGTALSNLGMTIAAGGGAFVPIGAIFGDLGTFTSNTGELILLSGEIAPAFTRPLFDIGVQLVLLASALVPGAAMAAPLQLAEPAADPGSGLSSLDSGIQTALINAIMALETATNKGIATLTSAISTPFSNLGTALSNLGMTIAAGGGAFVPIGAIFGDLGTFTSNTGELILLSGEIAPAFTRPLFDIGVQ